MGFYILASGKCFDYFEWQLSVLCQIVTTLLEGPQMLWSDNDVAILLQTILVEFLDRTTVHDDFFIAD